MKTGQLLHLAMGLVVLATASISLAQKQPQDSFWLERKWTNNFVATVNQFGFGIAIDATNTLYVTDGNRLNLYSSLGDTITNWPIAGVRDVATHPTSNLLVVCLSVTTSNQVRIYNTNGTLVRQWGTHGTGNGQFNTPYAIAVGTNDLIYVADTLNNRIQVFDLEGNYITKWGQFGTAGGYFDSPRDIDLGPDGVVYVADFGNDRVQMFSAQGEFLRQFKYTTAGLTVGPNTVAVSPENIVFVGDNLTQWIQQLVSPSGQVLYVFPITYGPIQYNAASAQNLHGATFSRDGQVLYVLTEGEIRVARRAYRTMGPLVPNALPLPALFEAKQRTGTTLIDVDFKILDPDDATVTVGAAAFLSNRKDLRAMIPMNTFEEGSSSNLGTNIPTGIMHRLTWNAAADWTTNFANVRIDIMAKDNRGLIDLHFLHIPSNAVLPELVINRSPLRHDDLLEAWTWLLATGHSSIALQTGDVWGVSGPIDGQLLAQTVVITNFPQTLTTDAGRAYLFELMNVREADSNEVYRAKVATTPTTVTKWSSRNRVGDLPGAVNEYGFDTGLFSTNVNATVSNAWWVVPLP